MRIETMMETEMGRKIESKWAKDECREVETESYWPQFAFAPGKIRSASRRWRRIT